MIVDGKRTPFRGQNDTEYLSIGAYQETIGAEVPVAKAAAIAKAKSVRVRLCGRVETELDAEAREMLMRVLEPFGYVATASAARMIRSR